jgi:HAAS domain-containing protein
MMTTEMPAADRESLSERYVWAAVRTAPGDQREELALEIRERIGDAVQARVDAGEEPLAAEHAALAELGDPEKLAAAYVDRPLYLIGPRYYLEWLRILKILYFIVLPIVLACLAGGSLLGNDGLRGLVAAVVGGGITVAVHMGFWTTFAFVLLQRAERKQNYNGTTVLGPWRPEYLQPVPGPRSQSRTDLVASVAWQLVLGAVWIGLAGSWAGRENQTLFDQDTWRPWLPWFLLLVVAEIGFEFALYRRGWSWAMAAVNALLQVAFAAPAIYLLLHGLLNQGFFDRVGWPEGGGSDGPVAVVAWVTILAIAASDIVQGVLKCYRMQQRV